MSYRPLPLVAQPRPAAWRSVLLWALMSALAIGCFSLLKQLEGDADIVQAPAASAQRA